MKAWHVFSALSPVSNTKLVFSLQLLKMMSHFGSLGCISEMMRASGHVYMSFTIYDIKF